MSLIKNIHTHLLVWLLLVGGMSEAMAQFPANIGKLPPGKTITICYEVTVDGDTPANTTEVCEQGVVTFNNPNSAGTLTTKTDDPDDPTGDEDETCTEVQVCDINSLMCPADVTVDNDPGECGADVDLPDPTVSDECAGATFDFSPASGSFFPVGTTEVTVTATDASGGQAQCTFDVTVNDTEDPVIVCPADITVDNDPGECQAFVDYEVMATDNCAVLPTVTFSTDPMVPGGTEGGEFVDIFAEDNPLATGVPQDMTFGPDGNLYVTMEGAQRRIMRYDPSGTFLGDFVNPADLGLFTALEIEFGPDGNLYAPHSGNSFSGNIREFDGTTGALLNTVPASGFVLYGMEFGPDGALYIAYNGGVIRFDLGTNTFSTFITDAAISTAFGLTFGPDGNMYICTASGIVRRYDGATGAYIDDFLTGVGFGREILFGPDGNFYLAVSNVVRRYNGTTGAFIDVFATHPSISQASGMIFGPDGLLYVSNQVNGGQSSILRFRLNSGQPSIFPVGTTVVTAMTADPSGNTAECSFNVTVEDNEDPVISCPADITVGNSENDCGSVVDYNVTATDNCPGVSVDVDPASGHYFPVGTTQVDATATDASGNTAECSFNVTVEDREAPEVECQELIFCNVLGEEITITPEDVITSLTDNCSAPNDITTVLSQTVFTDADLGENMVTVTATDEAGNEGTCETKIHLVGFGAVVVGDQSECDPWFNTYTQTLEITYAAAPGYVGNIVVNGQVFEANGSPQTVTLVDLISDGQPVDVVVSFEGQWACPQEFEDVFTAPQDCSVRCDISDITVGNAHDCDEEAGTYEQDIFLHYQGTNLTGFILVEIDGDNNFTPYPIENTSPQKITLTLPLDGQEHSVFVKFSDDQGCSFRAERLFRALHMCGCDIVGMEVFQEPRCNPDGTYNICFLVEGFNIPGNGGMLQINGQMVDYSSEPVVGGILLCARNIPGNGERGVDVFFKAEDNCTWTARDLYDAPLCDPDACMIEALTVLNATCTDPDPTYDLQLEVTHHNAPNSGTLDIEIGGMTYNFPIDVSPQVVNVFGLPATGAPVTVEARFSDDRDCKLRVEGLYDAPDCGFPCLISDIALAGEPVCDGDGEGATYSVDVVVTYENAPPTGNLRISINGTHTDVPITASPQTVTVEGLVPGGLPTDVTASFTDNANCQRTEPDMFVSPECGIAQPCDIFDIEVFEMTDCDPETNTYDICFEAIGIRLPFDRNDPAFKVIIGGREYEAGFTDGNGSGTGTLVCVNNVPADGREKDVFIQLTTRCSKYVRRLYTAPICEPDDEDEDDRCDMLSIAATQNYCDGDGTYTQRFELRYNDAPATGQIALEINGQWTYHNITGSPQTLIVNNLRADGAYVRVFAKFTDVDGCTIYERNLYRAPSDCRAARMAGTQREINIFPNPSNGQFKILATADSYHQAEVKVFNKLGQLVKEIEITENTEATLDMTDQPEGIYTVRITGDAYVVTQKVQVVR